MPPTRPVKDRVSSKKRILANRYQVEKRLGCGNFGTAFLVTDLKCNDEVNKLKVLKEIAVGDLAPDETVDAMHEAKLLSKLDHPNIVKFFDSFLDGEYFCIVTEYCEGGDLDHKINQAHKTSKAFDETHVIEWFVQLLLAVQYMHSRRVLHRDLKTRNIFLRNNMIKIGDFGISRILMGTTDMASTFTGTPYYMSPEVLKHEGYNSKSDVWSVGCILFELCALQHAFEGQNLMGVMYKIVEGQCPELPSKFSTNLSSVLKKMLTKEPEERPSAGEVLKMPYIAKQMERVKDIIAEKRNAKIMPDSTVIATKDTADIAQYLKEKSRLKDLQEKEKQDKLKNLSARERMRIRKKQKADEEYRKIQAAAQAQYIANQNQRTTIKSRLNESKPPPWSRSGPQQHQRPQSYTEGDYSYRPQTAPVSKDFLEALSDDEDDDDGTIVGYDPVETYQPNNNDTVKENVTLKPRRYSTPDERPITPMQNTMVYDLEHSSLDFKDGIPDEPALAETYYSQYEDFEEEEYSDDEYDDLINCMEHALASTGAAEMGKTATFVDDVGPELYGPTVRDIKIKNIRAECEKTLGDEKFKAVYDYLKDARKNTQDESKIHKGLTNLVDNPSDCFIVDQLLFLEEQGKS